MYGYGLVMRRWTGVVVAATCVLALGCSSVGEMGWIELAEVMDRAERRNLGTVEVRNRARQDPITQASRRTARRRVTRQELAAVDRLIRQTDDLLKGIDRVSSLPDRAADERGRLARSLTPHPYRPGQIPSIDGPFPLRTDFAGATSLAPDYLALTEMPEAPGDGASSVASEATGRPTARPARGPLPGFSETVWRDVKRIHRDLWDDTKAVYWNPLNAVVLITAGGASLALRPEVDDDVEDYYDEHHTMSEGWRDTFGVLGNPGFHFALAGAWYLVGQQAQHAKTYEVGKTLFSALIINGVSTSALKLCADTDSPNGEAWGWPSGHTSSAFTMASVLHQAYGHWVGIPLYGVAGMVGLARLDDREHHLSDVVFGAAMGLVVGHTVAGGRRPQIFGGDLIPYVDPTNGAGGIAWFKAIK